MAHFYLPDGTFIDGLREARKCDALPSPTTVLSLLKGEGLIQYFKRQMHLATATTPRLPGWTDDQYYDACVRWAEEHGQSARSKGGDFHDLCQKFHLQAMGIPKWMGRPTGPEVLAPQFDAYVSWYEAYVEKTLAVEKVVMGRGYGGRLDHLAKMRDGRTAVLDVKTQDTSKRKGKFNHYFEWALQLGAYAGALPEPVDCLISVCVSSIEPVVVEAHCWPEPPETYHKMFLGLLEVWKLANNYHPKPQPTPVALPV